MKKTHSAITSEGSAVSRYRQVVVGCNSNGYLLYFEWCMFLSFIPGAVGIFFRNAYWPKLFGSCGNGCMFANHIILRHPNRMHLGNNVIISEGCVIDARHDTSTRAVILGDNIMLSNNVMISCKNGYIAIENHVGINAHTIIQSTNNCPIIVGSDTIIGPKCYIVGGGNYHTDRLDIPIRLQGIEPDGGVKIGEDVWLGANVTVQGGVTVGGGSIAASGSIITRSIPAKSVCMGIPARIIKTRE